MNSGNGSVLICVDEYKEGEMCGRIYSMSETEPDKFTSAISLVKHITRIFDEGGGPQSTMRVRGFFKNKSENNAENPQAQQEKKPVDNKKIIASKINAHGKEATFRVRIMFRQNASWQGMVYWVEKNREENFRSALELLMLIDSSFAESQAAKGVKEEDLHAVNM
ncbi:MAG: hypothetical protein K6E85_01835 [Lachnospiraceae bacterium]|nr:hypothetical protein [Lachnospiraceae bacterium]